MRRTACQDKRREASGSFQIVLRHLIQGLARKDCTQAPRHQIALKTEAMEFSRKSNHRPSNLADMLLPWNINLRRINAIDRISANGA